MSTAIGWTDETWNPVRGCRRVSPGCEHCYAEVQAARIVRMGRGKPTAYDGLVKLVAGEARWTGEIALDAKRLAAPLSWRAPRRVFVDSMSDLFYDRRSNEDIAAVFGVMAACPQHTFQILTKYAARMRAWFEWVQSLETDPWTECHAAALVLDGDEEIIHRKSSGDVDRAWPLRNVWLGVSVENREHGLPRIEQLRQIPAAVRMLSIEPLLEDLGTIDLTGIGWVIIGCESGPGARPAKDAWFEAIAEQCVTAGVPLFVKQMMADDTLTTDARRFPSSLRRQDFPR